VSGVVLAQPELHHRLARSHQGFSGIDIVSVYFQILFAYFKFSSWQLKENLGALTILPRITPDVIKQIESILGNKPEAESVWH
jgi:hypothetical protein